MSVLAACNICFLQTIKYIEVQKCFFGINGYYGLISKFKFPRRGSPDEQEAQLLVCVVRHEGHLGLGLDELLHVELAGHDKLFVGGAAEALLEVQADRQLGHILGRISWRGTSEAGF